MGHVTVVGLLLWIANEGIPRSLVRKNCVGLTFQLAHPVHSVSRWGRGKKGVDGDDAPGFRAKQSAHLSLPGTERIKSWRVRSALACWRLLMVEAILEVVLVDKKRGQVCLE